MLLLLVGGGLFFCCYSRLLPYRYLGHSLALLSGRYDNAGDAGELRHREALAAALSGTLGLGNIAGVALAISAGGPGVVFWMWLTALIGVCTKFFTCTLGVMYRGRDSAGQLQGGPMYVIREALPRRWHWLAVLFALAGLLGTVPSFQVNQLAAVVSQQLLPETAGGPWDWGLGLGLALLVGLVIWGGLGRIARVAEVLVPAMVISYLAMAALVIAAHAAQLPAVLAAIFTQAFSPDALYGGALGVAIIGISRGAFSNEAGIGTEVMAHGAARTNEPVREGLVASLGPMVDTLLVCSCTAGVILVSGVHAPGDDVQGVSLTMAAFGEVLGGWGRWLLALQVLVLSATTVFTFWYYGQKCCAFLFGVGPARYYRYFYLAAVVLGAVVSVELLFTFLVGVYGLMALPTMLSSLLLAPRVMCEARRYLGALDAAR
ncbi:MAG: sodium/alanine symporter [Halioglobus sp.]|nr:sodium/alanine symporter [Halioglobus sp.]|tara:strand:+ start:39 stop:1334 length:1296 start_codon:yes stop_codon:yes gene_type:complete